MAQRGPREPSFGRRLRRDAGALVVSNFFRVLSAATRLHPAARPSRHRVEVVRNLPYLPTGAIEHLLDVYRPSERPAPWPVMIYVHGGAFRILSKDTHFMMGLGWARRGYLVFNISYRLAPRHPYPAAVEDTCAAFEWIVANAAAYGGDLSRLVIAGESAGANLATSLTLATCYHRSEPHAQRVFDLGVVPRAVMPACGIFQVSDPGRFQRRRNFPAWISGRLTKIADAYLRDADATPGALDLADPLVWLERGEPPARPLPPFFLPVGTRDPLLDDTRRIRAALKKLGALAEAHYYPGEIHAFHALPYRTNARRCWNDAAHFLERHLS